MNMTNTINSTPATNYQIGTFGLSKHDVTIVTEALEIAKRMRGNGDGAMEDTARAVILMQGAGLAGSLNEGIYGADEAAVDRQMVAYMDGVSELMAHFPKAKEHHCDCGSHSGC